MFRYARVCSSRGVSQPKNPSQFTHVVFQTLENAHRMPEFIRVGEADPSSTSISDIVAILPPRPIAAFLIHVFFEHATSFYYFVDRCWLDGVLDLFYTRVADLRSKDVTAACVLLMVFAIGTQYVHLESPEKQGRRNTRAASTVEIHGGWELDIGCTFYRQVAKLLSEVIHTGSLLSVQVFLLLGLYYLPLDASGLGYIYLNVAIKIAIQNGMHRNVSRGSFDLNTREVRRRIWWTTYCMERYDSYPPQIIPLLLTINANLEKSVYTTVVLHRLYDLILTWIYPRIVKKMSATMILSTRLAYLNPFI